MKRNGQIDFIKGVAIILMVICHAGLSGSASDFIYLFHMPVFFIASGYFFRENSLCDTSSLAQYAWRKVSKLWWPFVLWMSVFVLCHNMFMRLNIYTDDPLLLQGVSGEWIELNRYWSVRDFIHRLMRVPSMLTSEPMGGAMWFIVVLFWVCIFYGLSDFCMGVLKINRFWGQTAIALSLLIVAKFVNFRYLNYIGGARILVCYGLYHIGVFLRHYEVKFVLPSKRMANVIVVLLCFSILLICNKFEHVAIGANIYNHWFTLVITSVAGWFMLLSLANLVASVARAKVVNGIVEYLGRHTMPILILHFLAFKVISFIGVYALSKPKCLVAAFPILFEGGGWVLAYAGAGIVLPLLWARVADACKAKCLIVLASFEGKRND